MTEATTAVQFLIDRWPSLVDFAADAGVELGTAKQMRRRSSIAPGYWAEIVSGAATRGIADVTFEALGKAHAKPSLTAPEPCT